jgi:hypothetical protein
LFCKKPEASRPDFSTPTSGGEGDEESTRETGGVITMVELDKMISSFPSSSANLSQMI